MINTSIKRLIYGVLDFFEIGITGKSFWRGYYSRWLRPRYEKDIDKMTGCVDGEEISQIGIIIQGGIVTKHNFTLETAKLYKKIFPNCPVILSTWDYEKPKVLEQFRTLGIKVVVNTFPMVRSGWGNNNLQRKSTKSGIEYAIEKEKCKFILKTRTDIRIYAQNIFGYLTKLERAFPLYREQDIDANGRIISTSVVSLKNRLYNVSDLVIFGYAEDVRKYFSPPEDNRPAFSLVEDPEDATLYSRERPGEIWFSTHYLESIGHNLKWTFEDSLDCFRRYFIIIDAESIDMFWYKYSISEYRYRSYRKHVLQQLTFKDWVGLL